MLKLTTQLNLIVLDKFTVADFTPVVDKVTKQPKVKDNRPVLKLKDGTAVLRSDDGEILKGSIKSFQSFNAESGARLRVSALVTPYTNGGFINYSIVITSVEGK